MAAGDGGKEDAGPREGSGSSAAAESGNQMKRFVAERELEELRVETAMATVVEVGRQRDEKEKAEADRLAAVEVSKEDVGVLMREFGLEEKTAERRIRECGGDAVKAIQALLEE